MSISTAPPLSDLDRAASFAGDGPTGSEHLLRAVQTIPSPAATLLRTFGVTAEEVDRRFVPAELDTIDRPFVDLVEDARRGLLPPLVARPALLRELSIRLLSAGRRAVLLVGEPGCGRRSLVYLLAQALAERLDGRVSSDGVDSSQIASDVATIPLPERLMQVGESRLRLDPAQAFREAASSGEARPTLLWVPDIHTYFGGSARPADIDAGVVLRELIASGKVAVVGSTTPEAQRRQLAADAGLFDPMDVPEPDAEEVLAILRLAAPRLAATHHVTIAPSAIVTAADLARRNGSFTGVALPGSALRVIERACVEVRLAGFAGLGFAGEGVAPGEESRAGAWGATFTADCARLCRRRSRRAIASRRTSPRRSH